MDLSLTILELYQKRYVNPDKLLLEQFLICMQVKNTKEMGEIARYVRL